MKKCKHIEVPSGRRFECAKCGQKWDIPSPQETPFDCPKEERPRAEGKDNENEKRPKL